MVQALDVALGFDYQKFGEDVDPDENVKVQSRLRTSKVVQDLSSSPRETRSSSSSFSKITAKKPVRTSYTTIDMDIIEVMVNMEGQFGVEQRQVAPLLVHIMNKLGGQTWEPPSEESERLECAEETIPEDGPTVGKRKKMRELTFVLPSRKCLQRKLEDAALLNFQHVAETIERTNAAGGTVTAG